METQKLTRTPSSLLRSPTLRSSAHSLSSLDEQIPDDKKIRKPSSHPNPLSFFIVVVLVLTLLFSYFTPSIAHLLALSLSLALLSLILKKARSFLLPNLLLLRPRLKPSNSVQWFIGDDGDRVLRNGPSPKSKIVKEGVSFYKNGDFYEGEFHMGSCNGSGVYYFFTKGRYEGDWVDGKYDGYGIESWAKGSRYRGQYRNGLRHGFGAYRFFSGDSYAGEWMSGQSHGRGVQSCADGSCYVGEFKGGVKHGLGSYQFR